MKQKITYTIVAFILLMALLPSLGNAQVPIIEVQKPKQDAPKQDAPKPAEDKAQQKKTVKEKKTTKEKKQTKEKKPAKEKKPKRPEMRRGEFAYSLYAPALVATPYKGDADWNTGTGLSMGVGVAYTQWFNRHVGFSGGLRFSYIQQRESASGINSIAVGTMPINQAGTITYANTTTSVNTRMLRSDRIFALVEVPLHLSLQARHLYCNLGASFDYLINTNESYSYENNTYEITSVSGLGISLPAPIPVSIDGETSHNETPAKAWNNLFCMVSAELGWKFYFDYRNMLSLGVYGRYALNSYSVKKQDAEPISLVNGTSLAASPLATRLVDSYGYYEAGIRIAYHFGTGKSFER